VLSSDLYTATAWVAGLEGSVVEGGAQRRRTRITSTRRGLSWTCAGNPKDHHTFCKHCVALALHIRADARHPQVCRLRAKINPELSTTVVYAPQAGPAVSTRPDPARHAGPNQTVTVTGGLRVPQGIRVCCTNW
jgi:hypothetical protein